jgi:hypothetical protein
MFANKDIENELKKRIITNLQSKLNQYKIIFDNLQQTVNSQNNQIGEISSLNKEYELILVELENKMIESETHNKKLLDEIDSCKLKEEENLLFAELLQQENDLQKTDIQNLNTKLTNLIAEFEGNGDNELVKQLFAEEKSRIEQIKQLIILKNEQEQKNQELQQIINELAIQDETQNQTKTEQIQNALNKQEEALILRDKALALLGRKELEIDSLNVQINNLNTSLTNLSEEFENVKQLQNKNPEMVSKIESLQKQNEDLLSEIQIILNQKSNLQKQIEELTNTTTTTTTTNNIEQQKEDIDTQTQELNNTRKIVEERVLNNEKTLSEINQKSQQISEEFKKLKVIL